MSERREYVTRRTAAMRRAVVVVLVLLLTGCSAAFWDTVGDVAEIIDTETPQERCEANGGKWVRTFDKDGRVSADVCVLVVPREPRVCGRRHGAARSTATSLSERGAPAISTG